MHTSAVSSLPVESVSNLCLLGTGLSPFCSVTVACLRHRGDVEYMHQVHTLCAIRSCIWYTHTHSYFSIMAVIFGASWRMHCCLGAVMCVCRRSSIGVSSGLANICGQARRRRRAHLQHLVRWMGPERSGLLGLTKSLSHACCLVVQARKAIGRCGMEKPSMQSQ